MPKVSPQRKLWVSVVYDPGAPEARHSVSHSYSNNYVHIVYSTAGREDLIPPEMEPRLYSFVGAIAREEGIPLIAAGGMPNHSHLLVLLPPPMSLSIAINKLKTNSSRFMSQQGINFNWQKGYGAFSVSSSHLEKVKLYIHNQLEHHKKRHSNKNSCCC